MGGWEAQGETMPTSANSSDVGRHLRGGAGAAAGLGLGLASFFGGPSLSESRMRRL